MSFGETAGMVVIGSFFLGFFLTLIEIHFFPEKKDSF